MIRAFAMCAAEPQPVAKFLGDRIAVPPHANPLFGNARCLRDAVGSDG